MGSCFTSHKKNKTRKQEHIRRVLNEGNELESFKLFDVNNDGNVSVKEIRNTFKSMGTPLSLQESNDIMKRFDTDGNGEIDYREFCLFLREYILTAKRIRSGLFSFFDTNEDGYVSTTEFIAAMNQLGYEFTRKEANQVLKKHCVPFEKVSEKNADNDSKMPLKTVSSDLHIDAGGFLAAMKDVWNSMDKDDGSTFLNNPRKQI